MAENFMHNYSLVTDPQDVPAILQRLDRAKMFALDLETTGLDFKRDTIHGVSLATADQEWYVTLGAEQALYEPLKLLTKNPAVQVIGHNIMFDLHFLGKYGVRPANIIDTMIGQFLIDENQTLKLKTLAHTKLGLPDDLPQFEDLLTRYGRLLKKKKDDTTVYDIPLEILSEYAGRDSRFTYDLWLKTGYELQQDGMLSHFKDVEMPFTYVLMDMEESGFYIDQDKLAQLDVLFQTRNAEALELFLRLAGNINPNSSQQLAAYIYGTLRFTPTRFTDSGGPSTDALSLARLLGQDTTGSLRALMLHKRYEKLLSTYIERFKTDLFMGRLFGGFNQIGAVTGRLSSSGPNLQNIPSQGETGHLIKELFGVPTGYTFLDVDESQLELRILADRTRDEHLLQVFENNGDPHQLTMDMIKKLGYDIMRTDAKRVNFGWAYGVGPKGLADQIENAQVDAVLDDPTKTLRRPSEKDTKAWLDGFEKSYTGAARWKRKLLEYGEENGYVRTYYGRRRHLPDLKLRRIVRNNPHAPERAQVGRAERQAINSVIQGGAADILKWAMLQIHPLMPQYGARMTAQVHDELTFEVPTEVKDEFGSLVSKYMTAAGEFFNMRVKLIADPGYGQSWAESKK